MFYLTTHSTHFIYGYMAWSPDLEALRLLALLRVLAVDESMASLMAFQIARKLGDDGIHSASWAPSLFSTMTTWLVAHVSAVLGTLVGVGDLGSSLFSLSVSKLLVAGGLSSLHCLAVSLVLAMASILVFGNIVYNKKYHHYISSHADRGENNRIKLNWLII